MNKTHGIAEILYTFAVANQLIHPLKGGWFL